MLLLLRFLGIGWTLMASGSGFSIVRMMRSDRIRLGNDRFQGIKTIKEEITKPSSKMN